MIESSRENMKTISRTIIVWEPMILEQILVFAKQAILKWLLECLWFEMITLNELCTLFYDIDALHVHNQSP